MGFFWFLFCHLEKYCWMISVFFFFLHAFRGVPGVFQRPYSVGRSHFRLLFWNTGSSIHFGIFFLKFSISQYWTWNPMRDILAIWKLWSLAIYIVGAANLVCQPNPHLIDFTVLYTRLFIYILFPMRPGFVIFQKIPMRTRERKRLILASLRISAGKSTDYKSVAQAGENVALCSWTRPKKTRYFISVTNNSLRNQQITQFRGQR